MTDDFTPLSEDAELPITYMHIILFIQPLSNQPTSSLPKSRAGSFSGNTEPQLTSLALITNQVEFSLWPSIRLGLNPHHTKF